MPGAAIDVTKKIELWADFRSLYFEEQVMMATERQNNQGIGANCAVNGCSWSQRKLNSLLNLPCFDHKSLLKKDCSCAPPYKLHRMPDDPDLKRQWLAALKRKLPPQNLFARTISLARSRPLKILGLNFSYGAQRL